MWLMGTAGLAGADLFKADLSRANLSTFQIVPEVGQFSAFKCVRIEEDPPRSYIVELLIPTDAQRTSSLVGRKCRASHAIVVNVYDLNRKPVSVGTFVSLLRTGNPLTYRVGETVFADSFDSDIRVECSHGIHFFITFEEARAIG